MKNIFTKFMLRQPVRTVLLVLLMSVASFLFVMRSMEFIIINERINEISGYYRPVGYLSYSGEHFMTDVRPTADIVSDSPYINFDDRRRLVEAVLTDMPNTASEGINRGMLDRLLSPEDAFFTGTLTEIHRSEINPYLILSVDIDAVILGYPEHVRAGQTLDVHYFMDLNEIQTGITAIDDMVAGERYFLRGAFYDNWIAHESASPTPFQELFVMHPLSEVTYADTFAFVMDRNLSRDEVWYAVAPPDEQVDLTAPGLENLHDELRWIEFSLSRIRLHATIDMSYIPLFQPQSGARGVLTEGRWVNMEDNELSRPVVAVHEGFASRRGLSIGDTLRISIPPEQQLHRATGYTGDGFLIMYVFGEVFAPYAHTLELEIVGTFNFVNAIGMLGSPRATTFMYIPDSVLPSDVTLKEMQWSVMDAEEVVTKTQEEGFISPEWYSFVLKDARDADAFVLENQEALGEMGFYIEFMPGVAGAQVFWESADTILQTIRFNLLLFSLVAVLVLVLTVFLHFRQRQKDYAISRAMGNPAKKANRQLITALLLFATPTVIIGGTGGWLLALNEAVRVLRDLPGVEYVEFEMLWLPMLIIAVLAILSILMLMGIAIQRRPVLEMLQGQGAVKKKVKEQDTSKMFVDTKTADAQDSKTEASKVNAKESSEIIDQTKNIETGSTHFSEMHKTQQNPQNNSQLIFIFRHISRQRIKTVLAIAIAVLFVLALGYLQTAIITTEEEVDRLYNNTLVTGAIRQADMWDEAPGRFHNNVIRPQTIDEVAPFVKNIFIDACHEFSVLTAASEDGTLPDNWDMIAGLNLDTSLTDNMAVFNTLVGVNDLEQYVQINSPRATAATTDNEFTAFSWEQSENVDWIVNWQEYRDNDFPGMLINFAQDFNLADFKLTEGEPVPVILNNQMMAWLGVQLGDVIYIGTSTTLTSWIWEQTSAKVVGVHNINELTNDIFRGTIMPLEALEDIIGNDLRYMSIQFEIDPARNREMEQIREEITDIAEHRRAGEVPLRLFLNDEELRIVVVQMEQNLSLLRLLYPVAIALSVIIGFGLSLLLMLQNAKVVAIMRVLGTTKIKSRITLCIEHAIVCVVGLALGLAVLVILGWGFGFLSSLGLAGVYLAGYAIGTIVGAVVVSNRPPLELLQVKE